MMSPSGDSLAVPSRRRVALAAAIVVLAAIAAYSNGLTGEFVFDDQYDIVDNAAIRRIWPLWVPMMDSRGEHWHSRPVASLTFAINYAWAGLATWPYHVTNLAIHILAGCVLFGIARRTLLLCPGGYSPDTARGLAFLIALLWTLHPLQTQAVTYIVQRYESLMGCFYLLTVYSVLRSATSPRGWAWSVASAAFCLLSMGCKEVAISIPALVLLYDRTFLAGSFRDALRLRWGVYAALAVSWLVFIPIYRASSGSGERAWAGFGIKTPWYEYAATEFGVILHYLRLTIWPSGQCIDYGWPIARSAAAIIPPAIVVGALWRSPFGRFGAVRGGDFWEPGFSCYWRRRPASCRSPIRLMNTACTCHWRGWSHWPSWPDIASAGWRGRRLPFAAEADDFLPRLRWRLWR